MATKRAACPRCRRTKGRLRRALDEALKDNAALTGWLEEARRSNRRLTKQLRDEDGLRRELYLLKQNWAAAVAELSKRGIK